MIGNEKAEFAVKILLEYAEENGINGRDTTDLSPLEKWLILRLYSVIGKGEQLHKLLQYLSDEDELVGSRTHQEIIDSFNQLG